MKNKKKSLKESMGAGFSMTSGARNMFRSRGGFGGASNLGGGNSMYTYEIKPLNHTLEPKPNTADTTINYMRLGSKISAVPLRTNATPTQVRVRGILKDIKETENGSIMYYVVFDEATAQMVKCDPLTAKLLIEDPVTRQYPASDITPSGREKKIKEKVAELRKKKQLVSESLVESIERKKYFKIGTPEHFENWVSKIQSNEPQEADPSNLRWYLRHFKDKITSEQKWKLEKQYIPEIRISMAGPMSDATKNFRLDPNFRGFDY